MTTVCDSVRLVIFYRAKVNNTDITQINFALTPWAAEVEVLILVISS